MYLKFFNLFHILIWTYTFLVLKLTLRINEVIAAIILEEDNASLVFKNLHKCSCLANEMWFMDACRENVTTIQVLVDMYSSGTETINTNGIEVVEVGEIACPESYLNITLPGESFALRASGELFNLNYGLSLEFSKYCVEHFYIKDMNEVQLEVHLCLPVPSVPKCCPEDFYDGFNNLCKDKNETSVEISFLLGSNNFKTKTIGFSNILECHNSENRTFVSMDQYDGTANLKLTDEGLVLSHQVTVVGDKVTIPSPGYCLQFDSTNEYVLAASYCYEDPSSVHARQCLDTTCIRKCCSPNEIYDMDKFKCVHVNEKMQWTPKLYNVETLREGSSNISLDFTLVVGFPINCEFFSLRSNNDPPDIFKLINNGSLYVENWGKSLLPLHYCIDNFRYGPSVVEEALVCFLEEAGESTSCKNVESIVYPILVLISCVFMIVTLIVYAMIPDLHSKVQGKCLMANISSLSAAYIFMVIVQLSSSTLSTSGCITLGLLMQFSALASFFWLNVMSFDIWRTLRSLKTGKQSKSSARRRYLQYSLYAWGCPTLISLVTITMQFQSSSNSNLILPRIGETDCFFPITDNRPHWTYFYGFISATLIINTFFFIHLAIILLRAKQISEAALGKKNQIHKEWAKLYLKLFLVMGITWIFEVVSWVEGSCGFWIVTDIINSLRGLLIFIIFVCKKDVIKKLLSESAPTFNRVRTSMRQTSIFTRSRRTSHSNVDSGSAIRTLEVGNNQHNENNQNCEDALI